MEPAPSREAGNLPHWWNCINPQGVNPSLIVALRSYLPNAGLPASSEPEPMSDRRRSVAFPATRFASRADYLAWRDANRPLLDRRFSYERSLSSSGGDVVLGGACAPCLRASSFRSPLGDGERLDDGRIMPNWREQQICDCADALPQRGRALLHFLDAEVVMPVWARLLNFGPEGPGFRAASRRAESVMLAPRLEWIARGDGTDRLRLSQADGTAHVAMSSDYLQHVPALDGALAEIRRVLAPGGAFVFTVPFHSDEAATVSDPAPSALPDGRVQAETPHSVHRIGWDILDRLREAGFEQAHAYRYWAGELGYLGSVNTIFMAVR